MDGILQPMVAQLAIGLSVFSLITYLWLGLTVLLIGNRHSAVTWVGGIGLLMAALFFLCHGALVGAGIVTGPSPTDFWWHLAWVPGFAAPFFWAATGMHYANLTGGTMSRLRRSALVVAATLGIATAVLAVLSLPAIGHYGDFIRVLGTSLQVRPRQRLPFKVSPLVPLLGLAFVVYVAACAFLPWVTLVAQRLRPAGRSGGTDGSHHSARGVASTVVGASPSGNTDAFLLWDATDAWGRARRALLGASICMLCAGGVVALVGIATSLAEHNVLLAQVTSTLDVSLPRTLPGHVPLVLVTADLAVQVALAGLVLLIGWAVVRQGVLVERRLPQRGFLSHWRGTALVAGVIAIVVSWMAALAPEALPDLLVLVTLVTVTYALFTRQAYEEHDRLLMQLRPFITSLTVGHAGWLTTDPQEVERNVEALFTSLCRDVLGASRGRLALTVGRLHRTFVYTDPAAAGLADSREWTLPVSDERGVVARLALGPRVDGAGYTSADLEVARACGQRILDAVGEFAAAQAVASLARRRGLEAELSAALPRRVLHDEVLPRLHLAMLRLEALRGRVGAGAPVPPASVTRGAAASGGAPLAVAEPTQSDDGQAVRAELGEVVQELGKTHHDLAALMRAAPAANPRRIEHGLTAVLRTSLDGEFRGTFDVTEWDATREAGAAADALPAIVADLLLGASLEAVRNAGRHGRGDDMHRKLALRVALTADERWVTVTVSDDGVGLQNNDARTPREAAPDTSLSNTPLTTPGTRTGLLTHGALVALVGGSLAVRSQPGEGTTVTIRVPRSGTWGAE
ncbi:MAG: ATP-binding protein [Ktedonobacterales bacterium]